MSDQSESLAAKQERAFAALLEAPSIRSAAQALGIGESTLRRWLAEPAFRADYRAARRELVESDVGLLHRTAARAVAALAQNLTAPRPADRNRVAVAVLEMTLKEAELMDLAARVEALEQQAGGTAP
jgi:hypothetical protein